MESFFATVKTEEVEHFESYGEAKMASFDFIEVFDHQRRRHSTLGQISPAEFERRANSGGVINPYTESDQLQCMNGRGGGPHAAAGHWRCPRTICRSGSDPRTYSPPSRHYANRSGA